MPSSANRTPWKIAKIIGPGTNNLSLGLELSLTPNYLLYAAPYYDSRVIKTEIGCARLPESYNRSHPGDISMEKINLNLRNPLERIVTFKVDESQHLMVILTVQEGGVSIRYLTFEAMHPKRHPLALAPKTIIPFRDILCSYQLQIYGEIVGVLLIGHATSCLHIIGWANNTPHGHLMRDSPAGVMTSFSFLGKDKIFTTNLLSRSIDFWYFRPRVFQAKATIAMPSIAHGVDLENFVCTPLTCEQLNAWQDWRDLFVTFSFTMLIQDDAYAVVDFVLQKERLDQLSNHGQLTWYQWGNERVTCFDQSDAKDNCSVAGSRHTSVGFPHALGKPNPITIHEFNPPINSSQGFHLSVNGVSPFTERLVRNLCSYIAFEGHLHCDRVLVPDRRIFAIHDSPQKTIIILYRF